MFTVKFQRKHYTHLDMFRIVYDQNLDPPSQSSSIADAPPSSLLDAKRSNYVKEQK
jgi:hypothetical protein